MLWYGPAGSSFVQSLSANLLIFENPALGLGKLDIDGNAALHNAILWCDLKGVKLLNAAGADLETANNCGKEGATPHTSIWADGDHGAFGKEGGSSEYAVTSWDWVVYHIFARFGEVRFREAGETGS